MQRLNMSPEEFLNTQKKIQEKIERFNELKNQADSTRKEKFKEKKSILVAEKKKNKEEQKVKKNVHADILMRLKSCEPQVKLIKKGFVIIFPEVRLYTLNQMFAIMQYSKFHMFAYKKACHALVKKGLGNGNIKLTPPLKISLYRSGTRKVDNDSLCAMFKYFIDGLSIDKTGEEKTAGIITDDNPDVIQEYLLVQEKGEPCIALRVEMIAPKKDLKELFFF